MIGTKRKKGFGSSFATSARFFFRRLWDIVPVQTCVFKNQFDGTNESTDFQSHKGKNQRGPKIYFNIFHGSYASILDFWQCGKKYIADR